MKYAFMTEHQGQFSLSSMCRVLRIQRSGYYAWKAVPKSARTLTDESLMVDIKKSFEDSQGIYGSPAFTATCVRPVLPAARSALHV